VCGVLCLCTHNGEVLYLSSNVIGALVHISLRLYSLVSVANQFIFVRMTRISNLKLKVCVCVFAHMQ